jgi:branched chain amino acid efflux pump
MSWTSVLLLCAAAYALKLAGAVGAARASGGGAEDAGRTPLDALVVPVIAGLIAVQTVGGDKAVVLDARLPALGVAALLIWRRVPLLVVVLAAGAVAAGLRALG